jgi:hypothetical protein
MINIVNITQRSDFCGGRLTSNFESGRYISYRTGDGWCWRAAAAFSIILLLVLVTMVLACFAPWNETNLCVAFLPCCNRRIIYIYHKHSLSLSRVERKQRLVQRTHGVTLDRLTHHPKAKVVRAVVAAKSGGI